MVQYYFCVTITIGHIIRLISISYQLTDSLCTCGDITLKNIIESHYTSQFSSRITLHPPLVHSNQS